MKNMDIKYQIERENLCNRIISILDLDETHSILLNVLETDTDKQLKLLDMIDEIKKYFGVSCISPYNPSATCMRSYINIIRGILRKQGYWFDVSPILIGFNNGKPISTSKYIICKTDWKTN
jgi:hypothetical protein